MSNKLKNNKELHDKITEKYAKKQEKYDNKIKQLKEKKEQLKQEEKIEKSKIDNKIDEIEKKHGVRDLVSGLTHCVGAGLSLIGLIFLIIWAALYGTAMHVVTFTIFGVGLTLLYLFSTLYHWLNISERGIRVFRKFDHTMIYILIAATYTPVCLCAIKGGLGWLLFGVVWFAAVCGTVLSSVWINAPRWLTTIIYVAMGWVVVFAVKPLIETFTNKSLTEGLYWLLAGGIMYTIGGIIYGIKKPKKKICGFGFHEIFHVFVMLGSACHYWFIIRYVLQF
jgi:hemolysin III